MHISSIAHQSLSDRQRAAPPLLAPLGQRSVYLDLLRAAAILLVATGHMLAKFSIPMDQPVFGRPIWVAMTQLAVSGVDLFYVLSGFLIGLLLLSELKAEGTIRIGRFYARRALRLWPSYFLAILFASQWYRFVHPKFEGEPMRAPPFGAMWPFFLQVQNYYDIHVHHRLNIGAAMQTWTMVSLIHFYILLPPLLLLLAKLDGKWTLRLLGWLGGGRLLLLLAKLDGKRSLGSIRALPWVVLAIAVACLAMRWRAAPLTADGYDAWKHYFPTHLRIDEPMLGVLAAYWVLHARPTFERAMRYWPLVLLISVGALLPVALRAEEGPRFLVIWGYPVSGLGCLGLVLVAWWFTQPRPDGSRHLPPRPVAWFARIGVWSYSIYLWHQPLAPHLARMVRDRLFEIMVRRQMDPWHSAYQYLMSAAVYFSIVIAIGAAAYYLIEKPSLRLRERWIPREP